MVPREREEIAGIEGVCFDTKTGFNEARNANMTILRLLLLSSRSHEKISAERCIGVGVILGKGS